MWIRKAPYEVKSPLPEIIRHDQLPTGCEQLAYLQDNTCSTHWYFVKNNGYLSILDVADRQRDDGSYYYRCGHDDFPLEFLAWFPAALIEFQKPPAEGGLRAGAMTTPDIEVGGEMLCIQRALGVDQDRGGYIVENNSRCVKGYNPDSFFKPHNVCWASRFLYEGSLLKLIIDLGEKYKNGQL
ncbi:MAG: hypothetical protein B0W54_20875 [Cellvibrio sp. 79]|nr:MAG: hypothetical protein B0W54_20875 [Cellvibrio sp. 79]